MITTNSAALTYVNIISNNRSTIYNDRYTMTDIKTITNFS